jgi:hypothetical protein
MQDPTYGAAGNPERWERAIAGQCSHGGHGWDGETCDDAPPNPYEVWSDTPGRLGRLHRRARRRAAHCHLSPGPAVARRGALPVPGGPGCRDRRRSGAVSTATLAPGLKGLTDDELLAAYRAADGEDGRAATLAEARRRDYRDRAQRRAGAIRAEWHDAAFADYLAAEAAQSETSCAATRRSGMAGRSGRAARPTRGPTRARSS